MKTVPSPDREGARRWLYEYWSGLHREAYSHLVDLRQDDLESQRQLQAQQHAQALAQMQGPHPFYGLGIPQALRWKR